MDEERVQEIAKEIKRLLLKNHSITINEPFIGSVSITGIIIRSNYLNQIFRILIEEESTDLVKRILKLIIIMNKYFSVFLLDIFPKIIQKYEINGNEEINGEILHIIKISDIISINFLLKHFDESNNKKKEILFIIGELKGFAIEFTDLLINTLEQDDDSALRSISTLSLGKIKNLDSTKSLVNALEFDDSQEVRKNAAWALGEIKSKDTIECLINTLEDKDIIVQTEVVKSLGNFYKIADKASDKLMNLLTIAEIDNILLKEIIWSLGKIRVCECIPKLIDIMRLNFDPMIREAAINVISYLYHFDCKNAEDALIDLISIRKQDSELNVRLAATKTLEKFREKSGLNNLDDYIKTIKPYPDKLEEFWEKKNISKIEEYFDKLVETTIENRTLMGISYFTNIESIDMIDSFNVYSLLSWLGYKLSLSTIVDAFTSLHIAGLIQEYMGGYRLTKDGRKMIIEITSLSTSKDKTSNTDIEKTIKPTVLGSNEKQKEKVKVLILASDPINLTKLEQNDEVKKIKDQLMKKEDLFDVNIELAVRKKDLVDIITRYKPNIIHFIGHGNPNGKLKLKDEINGKDEDISAQALATTFDLSNELQCVFLNACYTDETAEYLRKSTDCIIGIARSVDDEVALYIAEGFYIGIKNKLNVHEALESGIAHALNVLENRKKDLENELEKSKCIAGRRNPKDIYFIH